MRRYAKVRFAACLSILLVGLLAWRQINTNQSPPTSRFNCRDWSWSGSVPVVRAGP